MATPRSNEPPHTPEVGENVVFHQYMENKDGSPALIQSVDENDPTIVRLVAFMLGDDYGEYNAKYSTEGFAQSWHYPGEGK